MLDLTLATRFEPSSNLKGEVVGGNWRFVLPTLELDQAVVIGTVSPATTRALHQTVRRVTADPAGVAPGTADLVVVAAPGARSAARDAGRLLRPGGAVFAEGRHPELGAAGLLWLSPPGGEVDAVAPLTDREAIAFLERHARADSGVRRTPAERVRRWLRRRPLSARLRPRVGTLAGGSEGPPAYLRELAAEADLDISGWRYALSAPGRYASKKVLVFLFDRSTGPPAIVVKLTRDPAHNGRLENEGHALRALEAAGFGAGTAPRVVFAGRHAGLAVVAESALDGVPFRVRTTGRADCRWLEKGIAWLDALGTATANPSTPGPEVAAALHLLVDRYAELLGPPESHRAFLEEQLAIVSRSEAPFPLVFQHGDPGTWNALALPDGRVGFLDWEAAEPEGMPLWDLFYFLRSYSVSTARRPRGEQSFLSDPALVRVAADAISGHAAAIGLERSLVGPLFYASLVHRTLKEVTRLPAERIGQGHFARLLGRCIDRRDDEPLSTLLAAPGVADETTSEGVGEADDDG